MAKRTCSVDGCQRAHQARGYCGPHYSVWHRRTFGRKASEYHSVVCIVCKREWSSRRCEARLCSDACRGKHYSAIKQTRCKLPEDHPVMLLIAEARKPKPKPERVDLRTARECPACASRFSPLFHSAATQMVCCSKRCAARMGRLRRRAREHNARGSWTWAEFMRIAKKFDFCCAYCGVMPDRLDADHVVPLSRGGSDSPTNLLPTCLMCNSSKCAMSLTEWAAWLAERGQPARQTTWNMGDPRYAHLTDALLAWDIAPAA